MLGALIVWWPASFWLQWTMAEGTVHTGSPAKFPTKPTEEWKKNRKMYAIKQIKICAEYRDMLPRPQLDLSGTPGLRPIGLSPGSWQTSLGLGSMSRYSAQILICIIRCPSDFFLMLGCEDPLDSMHSENQSNLTAAVTRLSCWTNVFYHFQRETWGCWLLFFLYVEIKYNMLLIIQNHIVAIFMEFCQLH